MQKEFGLTVNNLKNDIFTMCKELDPDYFVTLTFRNNSTKEDFAIKSMNNFLIMVSRAIFGKRSKKRLHRMIIKERNQKDGIHFHLLIKHPETDKQIDIKNLFKKYWTKIKHHGYAGFDKNDEWFKDITDLEGLVHYLTKQINQLKDNAVVYDLCFYN